MFDLPVLAMFIEFLTKRPQRGFLSVGGGGEWERVKTLPFWINGVSFVGANFGGVSNRPRPVYLGR